MPIVNFSDEDIKSGYLVKEPGRYNYEIAKVTVKPAKSDQSANYLFQFKGVGSHEMNGVVVFVLISSKAKWLLTPIFRAANGGQPLGAGVDYNTDDLVGVLLSAMTSRGQRDDGTYFNALGDWQPAI